ncbi:MAG: hypothetical protein WC632_01570 [Candidatus Margulisiibacteriota bacterium]
MNKEGIQKGKKRLESCKHRFSPRICPNYNKLKTGRMYPIPYEGAPPYEDTEKDIVDDAILCFGCGTFEKY